MSQHIALSVEALTALLFVIVAVLIPLTIWAVLDVEQRRQRWQTRRRLRQLSRQQPPRTERGT